MTIKVIIVPRRKYGQGHHRLRNRAMTQWVKVIIWIHGTHKIEKTMYVSSALLCLDRQRQENS